MSTWRMSRVIIRAVELMLESIDDCSAAMMATNINPETPTGSTFLMTQGRAMSGYSISAIITSASRPGKTMSSGNKVSCERSEYHARAGIPLGSRTQRALQDCLAAYPVCRR